MQSIEKQMEYRLQDKQNKMFEEGSLLSKAMGYDPIKELNELFKTFGEIYKPKK